MDLTFSRAVISTNFSLASPPTEIDARFVGYVETPACSYSRFSRTMLLRLPPDLAVLILEKLDHVQWLESLSQTCTQFKKIAFPILRKRRSFKTPHRLCTGQHGDRFVSLHGVFESEEGLLAHVSYTGRIDQVDIHRLVELNEDTNSLNGPAIAEFHIYRANGSVDTARFLLQLAKHTSNAPKAFLQNSPRRLVGMIPLLSTWIALDLETAKVIRLNNCEINVANSLIGTRESFLTIPTTQTKAGDKIAFCNGNSRNEISTILLPQSTIVILDNDLTKIGEFLIEEKNVNRIEFVDEGTLLCSHFSYSYAGNPGRSGIFLCSIDRFGDVIDVVESNEPLKLPFCLISKNKCLYCMRTRFFIVNIAESKTEEFLAQESFAFKCYDELQKHTEFPVQKIKVVPDCSSKIAVEINDFGRPRIDILDWRLRYICQTLFLPTFLGSPLSGVHFLSQQKMLANSGNGFCGCIIDTGII